MSLDVYLYRDNSVLEIAADIVEESGRIEIAEHLRQISLDFSYETLFTANITHNLGRMAREAGIYTALWRPEEIGVTHAGGIISDLERGLAQLKSDPHFYRQFEDPNGWGTYKAFVPWVERYLEACKKYPDAVLEVSR